MTRVITIDNPYVQSMNFHVCLQFVFPNIEMARV